MTETNGNGNGWKGTLIHVALVGASFLVSGLVEWGYMSAKMADFDRRITVLEANQVTNREFREFREDLFRELGQVEANRRIPPN